MINATIKYLVDSERFDVPLQQLWSKCLQYIYDSLLFKNKIVTLNAYDIVEQKQY